MAENCYADCHNAECYFADCFCVECRYIECHYAECSRATNKTFYDLFYQGCALSCKGTYRFKLDLAAMPPPCNFDFKNVESRFFKSNSNISDKPFL